MGDGGLELFSEKTTQALENNKVTPDTPKSKNGPKVHNRVHTSNFPPELLKIIDLWPDLPEHIKQQILDTVRSVRADSENQ